MKEIIQDSNIGEIIYDENLLTGNKSLYINGKSLVKMNKTTFALSEGEEKKYAVIEGNLFTGITLKFDGRKIVISNKPTWYEITLSVLMFVINLVWGNSVALCSIIPICGGAIGGAICGALMVVSLSLMIKTKGVAKKVLIGLGMIIASFILCFFVGMLLISLVA